ncbi:hypothetical protein JCM3774_000628 [Rhodotorula dairenensis]
MAALWDEASVGKKGLVRTAFKSQNPRQPRLAYVSEPSSKKAGKRPLDPPPIVRLRTQREGIDENNAAGGSEDGEEDPAFSRLTHNLFLFATLLPEHACTTDEDQVRQARNDLVTGTLFSSLSQFRGRSCFAFPDLNVLEEGRWKFCMSLYEFSTTGVRFETSVVTEAFEVFSHARFPLLDSSSEVFRNFFARAGQDPAPKASFSAKPTSRSSVPRKLPKKPRAAPSQSFSSRPNQPCYTPLTHIPYQRQPRSSGTEAAAADSLPAARVRKLPVDAGTFSVYPRVRPSAEAIDPEAPVNHAGDHFRLPARRSVAAGRPAQDPLSTATTKDSAPAQRSKPRSRQARAHADFRNDELETASVKRRRVSSPPPVLAPLRGQSVGSLCLEASAASRRKGPSQAVSISSVGSVASKSKPWSTPKSPPFPSTFADLLAAAAAVEQEDVAAAARTKRNCPCRQPADAPCARELDPLPNASASASVYANGSRPSPPSPLPTKQDGSSSLSRLLGVGKDPKTIETNDQSPMFL